MFSLIETCNKCGRKVNLNQGNWTSWGGKYPQLIFLCNRCMGRLEKEEAQAKLKPFNEVAEFAKSFPSPIQIEDKCMVAVLTDLCKVDGWYKLMYIAEAYFLERNDLGLNHDSRYIMKILDRLGFKEHRRLGGGYTHVWISKDIIKNSKT